MEKKKKKKGFMTRHLLGSRLWEWSQSMAGFWSYCAHTKSPQGWTKAITMDAFVRNEHVRSFTLLYGASTIFHYSGPLYSLWLHKLFHSHSAPPSSPPLQFYTHRVSFLPLPSTIHPFPLHVPSPLILLLLSSYPPHHRWKDNPQWQQKGPRQ